MLLIKNSKVYIGYEFLERNILVGDDGKIKKIAVAAELKSDGAEVIDAAIKYALPGLIDVHVHCREPGMEWKEDFRTASMAAAAGGVTTMFDMPNTKPPTTTVQLLEEKRKLAAARCLVNYGFYIGATAGNIDEIAKAENVAGVKLYMGSTTGDLAVTDENAIKKIFGSGKIVVAHAEDEQLIKKNSDRYKDDSKPEIHAKIRNNEVAVTAVKEALRLAQDCNIKRLHITHSSTKEEMLLINEAKKKMPLSCDVTPHHLFLTADEMKRQDNFAKMNPPLRNKADVEALWQAISYGVVDCIATDHAPHTIEEKEQDYWKAPSGVPGLETMLPLLLDAVNKNRLSLQRLVQLTSENPAAMFGIKGKGKLAVGMDADITIVDLAEWKTIKNDDMLTKCGWTPFDGWKVKGAVATTIVNGNVIYSNGEITEEKTKGREAIFNGN